MMQPMRTSKKKKYFANSKNYHAVTVSQMPCFVIDFYQKLRASICLYSLSPNLVVGAMSYISVFGCDICGWVVVFLFRGNGVHMCMCLCV